jgi:hypothetical protein
MESSCLIEFVSFPQVSLELFVLSEEQATH